MHETYLDELRAVLARVRRRWLTARSMRATARATSVAFVFLLFLLLTDRFLRPADLPMVALFLAALLLVATVFVRTVWSLRRAPTDRQIARFIEERCPALEDRLASATELARGGGRSAFRDLVVGDAARRTRDVDLDLVVPRAEVRRSIAAGLGATVALVIVLIVGFGSFGRIARTAWLYAFPYTAQLRVEPGDARVVAGQSMQVHASLEARIGAVSRSAPTVTITPDDGEPRTAVMTPVDGGYELELQTVDTSFRYRVRAASVVSEEYDVTALFPPRVRQIDVSYEFPSATRMAPRVDTDGGDIYAPTGTQVTVSVQMTKPVAEGWLSLGDGRRVALSPSGATLRGAFEVSDDDTYRVRAIDRDGLTSAEDVDYFIRTVRDHPPTVDIVRPKRDRDITSLEEVVIEARAEDDYGLERFELVYGVVGRPERIVDLRGEDRAAAASASHTIFAEELGLQAGDFISYYARARDTGMSRDGGDVRSDIYFLQVRPFHREFEEAQSQGGGGVPAEDLGRLADVQKEIIVATWKLDGQPVERVGDDIETVAGAQGELRLTAQLLAARTRRPAPEADPEIPVGDADADRSDPLGRAVAAMGEAETALRDTRLAAAIPEEMRALSQLLKAQAEAGRTQVSQGRSQGGRGTGPGAQEDLSELFDEALRRDQQTSYENRSSAGAAGGEEADNELEERLRELAERQQALTEQQRDLALRESELDEPEIGRQLERLTRKQEELRRQMEELQRAAERTERSGSGPKADPSAGRRASDQMRQALSELRRGELSEAADRAQDALETLRELEREAGRGSKTRRAQALGELRLEAQQVAESQRQMARETGRLGGAGDGSSHRRLAEQEQRLADRVDSLTERLEQRQSAVSEDENQMLERAAEELRTEDVAEQMRDLADALRRAGALASDSSSSSGERGEPDPGGDEIGAELREAPAKLADVMNRVATTLAEGGRPGEAEERLSEDLENAQELGQRLEQIEQRLGQMTGGGSETGPEASSELTDDRLAGLQDELGRQLGESPELREQLRRARPSLEQDLRRWEQYWRTGAAPGNEAFKRDLSEWASLYRELRLALEEFEVARSLELTEEARGERLHVGPSQTAPERYRRLVDEYYRALASGHDGR